jgi:hypothetical protein
MRRKIYWLLLLFLGLPNLAVATREICGAPPSDQPREEISEFIKGELAGKANLLSSYVGKAELGGKIEAARQEIFAKYPDPAAASLDRYLLYMFCFVLFDPKNTQSSHEKIKAIQEFKRQQPPLTQNPIIPSIPTPDGASTNRDEPTWLPSNEIRGIGIGERISYYYTFNAGPGIVKVTIDGKNKRTGYTNAIGVELSALDAKRLLYIQTGNTHGDDKRVMEQVQVGRRQQIIMRVLLAEATIDYMIRLEGAVNSSPTQKSKSGN